MLKLFNTYSRKKEVFRSICRNIDISKCRVGLYTCGPTVYNYAHIGNLRTYIFEDILRRTLEQSGYKVKHVMNITDVEDKIIREANKSKKNIGEFTKPYELAFFSDLKKLNIKKASKYPKATLHIKEMVSLIQKLIQKKVAYVSDDGVYFNISKFKKYGRLSKLHLASRKLSRVSADEYDKNHAQDFALWKFTHSINSGQTKSSEPSWKAPFGVGRPGWHIECSAMSMKYLGQTFDIHAGGVDLIFPHHENEIAQSESATGKKFVNYFLEGEHLLVDSEKMSKSLGNIFTLRDLESKKINPLAYRYFVLGAHYRSKLNFTWEALKGAEKALERLYEALRMLKNTKQNINKIQNTNLKNEFRNATNDDLNTPKALAILWKAIKCGANLKLLYEFDEVLGLNFKNVKRSPIPKIILELAQKREKFRKLKNWSEADKIREKIKKSGYSVEDTPKGPCISQLVL